MRWPHLTETPSSPKPDDDTIASTPKWTARSGERSRRGGVDEGGKGSRIATPDGPNGQLSGPRRRRGG